MLLLVSYVQPESLYCFFWEKLRVSIVLGFFVKIITSIISFNIKILILLQYYLHLIFPPYEKIYASMNHRLCAPPTIAVCARRS